MQREFRAARAAALLLIASGAGGAASAYLPRLDERWIFVGAVAAIAAIDGVVFGIVAAIVAPFAYELVVHSSFTFAPSRDTLTLAASLGAAILIGAARALMHRPPRLRETRHRMLLPPHVEEESASARIEELEARLADARARSGAMSKAQIAKISELDTDLSDARSRLAAAEARVAQREHEIAEARAQASRIAELESQLANAQTQANRIPDLEERLAQRERELADARANAEASIEAQRAHIAELESQLASAQTQTNRIPDLEERLAQRERELADARANADASIETQRAHIADVEHQLADARANADASINSQRAQIAELETERAHASARVAELERRLDEGAMHVEQFERTVDLQRSQIAELQQSLDDARERHRRAAADHDAAQRRVAELQQALDKSNERIAELDGGLADSISASDQREAALEAARATSESLAARVAELEVALDAEREKVEAEFSEKLNTIVTHLASDHEVDLGEALMEREAARAEVRDLNSRMAELKRMLDEKSAPPEHGFTVVNLGEAKKRSVLLIHRDAMLRTTAKRALERNGYKVTTAADGLEALRIAMTERPDVILADTQMPKMDGRALVQLLKSRSETADMKIVLIGAPVAPNEDGSEFRADDFIRDPSNVESLKSTIESVLAAR